MTEPSANHEDSKTVSVVLPVYNEKESIPILFEQIQAAMDPTQELKNCSHPQKPSPQSTFKYWCHVVGTDDK